MAGAGSDGHRPRRGPGSRDAGRASAPYLRRRSRPQAIGATARPAGGSAPAAAASRRAGPWPAAGRFSRRGPGGRRVRRRRVIFRSGVRRSRPPVALFLARVCPRQVAPRLDASVSPPCAAPATACWTPCMAWPTACENPWARPCSGCVSWPTICPACPSIWPTISPPELAAPVPAWLPPSRTDCAVPRRQPAGRALRTRPRPARLQGLRCRLQLFGTLLVALLVQRSGLLQKLGDGARRRSRSSASFPDASRARRTTRC